MKKSVVISLGGSVISGDPVNTELLEEYSRILEQIDVDSIGMVAGGGSIARSYIRILREYGVSEFYLDNVGILSTRINAYAVSSILKDSSPIVPTSFEEAISLLNDHRIVVMGGVLPGFTTDAVSALFAESIGSKILVNATAVDGVYDVDPNTHPNASKIARLTYDEAIKLSFRVGQKAGSNVFMDSVSLGIAKRSHIRVFVIDGRSPEQIRNIVERGECSGTIIE